MPASRSSAVSFELDRLRGAQAAGVHRLEQRAVTERGGRVSGRLREQTLDLVAAEHLRQAAGRPRRAELRGRVVLEDLLAAQMAIKRAQAGDLALERRRRDGRPLVGARRELSDERRELLTAHGEWIDALAVQKHPVLLEVRAVGLEGVPRQASLELEVREKIKRQIGQPPGRRRRVNHDHARVFALRRIPPAAARDRSGSGARRPDVSHGGQVASPATAARSATWSPGTRRSRRRSPRAATARSRSARTRRPGPGAHPTDRWRGTPTRTRR